MDFLKYSYKVLTKREWEIIKGERNNIKFIPENIWKCDNDYGLKYFLIENIEKKIFFYFFKIIFNNSISKWFENIKK